MADVRPLDNYAGPQNLQSRISIHSYAVDPGWMSRLFEREFPAGVPDLRILDLGCGTGTLWTENLERIGSGWSLTLVDSSAGMLDAAHASLGDRADYVVADAQVLPFPDAGFDVVVANHMLYHVPDRPAALAEIARVIAPGGAFHCSTNGRGHLRELAALAPGGMNIAHHCEEFGLETGPGQLEPYFTDIRVQRFDNSLHVPAAEPILAYIRSGEGYRAGTDLSAARTRVDAEIARSGYFGITTCPGLISGLRRQAAG